MTRDNLKVRETDHRSIYSDDSVLFFSCCEEGKSRKGMLSSPHDFTLLALLSLDHLLRRERDCLWKGEGDPRERSDCITSGEGMSREGGGNWKTLLDLHVIL